MSNLTFEEILLEEPRLLDLMNDGYKFSLTMNDSSKKTNYWYKILKPKILMLVGFNSNNSLLSSCEVYDKIYQFFIKLMSIQE